MITVQRQAHTPVLKYLVFGLFFSKPATSLSLSFVVVAVEIAYTYTRASLHCSKFPRRALSLQQHSTDTNTHGSRDTNIRIFTTRFIPPLNHLHY
jgi:hypothetical protein